MTDLWIQLTATHVRMIPIARWWPWSMMGLRSNELQRGMIDYFAGQYAIAADVLKSYMDKNEIHEGSRPLFPRPVSHKRGRL